MKRRKLSGDAVYHIYLLVMAVYTAVGAWIVFGCRGRTFFSPPSLLTQTAPSSEGAVFAFISGRRYGAAH